MSYPKINKSDTTTTDEAKDGTYNPASLPFLLNREEWGSDLLRWPQPD
jgi:hypothetical protein